MKRTKKRCCLLMALVMALCLLPAGAIPAAAADAPAGLKVLAIGDRLSRDATQYLYKIAKAEGVQDVVIANLYTSAVSSLDDHAARARAGSKSYTLNKNTADCWYKYSASQTITSALQDEAWDFIVLEQSQAKAGDATSYDALSELVEFVRQNAKGTPKLLWNEGWAGSMPYTSAYASIRSAVKSRVESMDAFAGVVPTGTAVQNARSSFLGPEGLHADEAQLNQKGMLLAGYVLYGALTGSVPEQLAFTDVYGQPLSAADTLVIGEAARAALARPDEETRSAYAAEPQVYTVTVDGHDLYSGGVEGMTVAISATEGRWRTFRRWEVVSGDVTLADPSARETSFTMPARNVELRGVYEEKPYDRPTGDTGLRVGFGQADITPSQSAPLAGYGSTRQRMSQGTLKPDDRIMATAITFSDGVTTHILFTVDLIRMPNLWLAKAQKAISEATGVPAACISASATHTHAAPDIGDQDGPNQTAKELVSENPTGTKETWYFEEWLSAMVAAARQSVADLSPVSQTKVATVFVDGMNWMRHWRYGDGTMGGVNAENASASAKGVPRPTDQDLQVVRFVRTGEKKDVVLINWQGHPTTSSTSGSIYGAAGRPFISADYPGYLRRYVEEQDGHCRAAFFLGASGDVNTTTSMRTPFAKYLPPYETPAYAVKLGRYVMDAMDDMTVVDAGRVQSMRLEHVAFNTPKASNAEAVVNVRLDTLEESWGVADMTRKVQQDVVTLGSGVAFVTAAYEMFDINGMDVKEASPFAMTFVCTCTGATAYVASWETFRYDILNPPTLNAYETKYGQCKILPGSGDDMAASLIAMLSKLYRNL